MKDSMGPEVATHNVNRSYSLAATCITIFTFMLFFLFEVRERPDKRFTVSSRLNRDGCGDVLIRVRVLLLLLLVARQPDR